MSSFRATCNRWITRGVGVSRGLLAQWSILPLAARSIWGALNLLTLIVVIRRLFVGAPPSPTGAVVAIGLCIACANLVARHLCRPDSDGCNERRRQWWSIALSAVPFLGLLLVTRPSAFGAGCLLATASYSLAASWTWWNSVEPLWFEAPLKSSRATFTAETAGHLSSGDPGDTNPLVPIDSASDTVDEGDELKAEASGQWMSRSAVGAEEDLLEAVWRAEFAAGQKLLNVHIPFSPPFDALPHLECEVTADSEVRQKVAAVYRYGTRIELRRSGTSLPEESVELHIAASVARIPEAA